MAVRALLQQVATWAAVGLVAAVAGATPAAADVGQPPPPDRPDDAYCGKRYSYYPLDCWIHEPVVNQPATDYPILFQYGDHVRIEAGGCVQTGGRGRTWKRYVDPQSDNGQYHGLINVPGVTAGMQQVWTALGRTFTVDNGGGYLTLGYQDDGYSDNGYYAHDDGTGDQCKNSVNAWVHIVATPRWAVTETEQLEPR